MSKYKNVAGDELSNYINSISDAKKQKAAKNLYEQWKTLSLKKSKLTKKIQGKREKGSQVIMAFITFNTIAYRDFILAEFTYSPISKLFRRFLCCCCCQDRPRMFHIEGKSDLASFVFIITLENPTNSDNRVVLQ